MSTQTYTQQGSVGITSGLNYIAREDRLGLIEGYPGQLNPQIIPMLEIMGRSLPTRNRKYRNWETTRMYPQYQVGAVVTASTGAGSTVRLQLAAACHTNGGTVSNLQNNTNVIVKGRKVAQIRNVDKSIPNAHTFDLVPKKTSVDLGTFAVNDFIIHQGNDYGEGESQPSGYTIRVNEIQNHTQRMKATYDATGDHMVEKVWWSESAFTVPEFLATELRFEFEKEMTYMTGDKTDNPLLNVDQTTEGIIPMIENNGGIKHNYALGGFSLQDFDQMRDKVAKNHGAKYYCLFAGLGAHQEWTNTIADKFTGGAISYAAFRNHHNLNPEMVSIKMGFQSLYKDGVTWHVKAYRPFEHPEALGSTGFNYRNMMVGIPISWNENEKNVGEMIPSIAERYMAHGDVNRKYKMWDIGAWATRPTTGNDSRQIFMLCDSGIQWSAPHQYMLVEGL